MTERRVPATCLIDSIDRNQDASLLTPKRIANMERGQRDHKIGRNAQRKVERALLGLNVNGRKVVQSVTVNETNGDEDRMGHDLTVVLPDGTYFIQVKASDQEMEDYMDKIEQRLIEQGAEDTSPINWMFANRIILLNGSDKRQNVTEIRLDFLFQLKKVREFQQANLIPQTA